MKVFEISMNLVTKFIPNDCDEKGFKKEKSLQNFNSMTISSASNHTVKFALYTKSNCVDLSAH